MDSSAALRIRQGPLSAWRREQALSLSLFTPPESNRLGFCRVAVVVHSLHCWAPRANMRGHSQVTTITSLRL